METDNLFLNLFLVYIALKIFNMSWIKDFNELPISVKSFVFSLLVFMPCWAIILYYFFPNILSLDWYKIAMFAFVPALIWYVLQLAISYLYTTMIKKVLNIGLTDTEFWVLVLVDGMLYLTVIIIIAYYLKFSFEKFAWIAFLFRFCCVIFIAGVDILVREKYNQTNNHNP